MVQRRAFTPLAGADDRLLAVALVDGRCAYLEADSRCGIHRSGRAEDKPLGCRTYPARFVDDGAAVRVSPWLECPCVLASGERPSPEGEPLTLARSSAEIDPAIFIETLPESIRVGFAGEVGRAAFAEATLDLAAIEVPDGAAALISLGSALDAGGLALARAALEAPSAPSLEPFRPALAAIRVRVERLAAEEWRSAGDFPRRLWTALLGALDLLDAVPDEILAGPGAYRDVEAFYVRALLFGHQLAHAKGRYSSATLARDRALRIILARALVVVARLAELDDPAFLQPLALVEAASRAYGLVGYLADLGTEAPAAVS
jgi:lysine-N-methylase